MARKRKVRGATLYDISANSAAEELYRPVDIVWDTICELFYPSGVPTHPKSLRSHVNAIVAGLKELGATPEEIRRRRQRWPELFPRAIVTAQALLKHWDLLAEPAKVCRNHAWRPIMPKDGTVQTCENCGKRQVY